MHTFSQDIRYALRQFRRSPAFTLTALATLAFGIGATTAIFSLVNAVMLRSLPVADPASLYRIGAGQDCCVNGGLEGSWSLFSFPLFQRLQQASPEFEQVTAFQARAARFNVRRQSVDRLAKPLRGEFVTGNYFLTFGVGSFFGRTLKPPDDAASATPVAMLSYNAWVSDYGSDPSVVGSTFFVEGHPFTIVGVSPPGFYGETLRSEPPELWLPMQQEPMVEGSGSLLRQPFTEWLRIIGRLRPGANTAALPARLTGVLRHWLTAESGVPAEFLAQIVRELPKQQIEVIRAGAGVGAMKAEYGSTLAILFTVCFLVLLIACANIANLLLARGMARRSQFSIRLAIGASRRQVIRQCLTESILLSLAGGLGGVGVAYLGAHLVLMLALGRSHSIPIDVSPSPLVLCFAIALSFLTGIVFGTAPAWFASSTDPAEALRGANRSTAESASLARKALLVSQATLSVVLLAGAGMLTQSLRNLEHQHFGFQTDGRVTVSMNSPSASYSSERLNAMYKQLEERLSQIPGVRRAALALYTPFDDNWADQIYVSGHAAPSRSFDFDASWDRVSPSYFETIGQPILRGRGITERDNNSARRVAVVNQAFVRRFFGKEDPMGKHFGMENSKNANTFEVVGVVGDAKYTEPEKPTRPMFFLPITQQVSYAEQEMQIGESRSHLLHGLILETNAAPGALEPQIRKVISGVDPDLTVVRVETLGHGVAANFDQQRAVAQLTGLFGVVALLLAAIGLYGVTAYTVARRTSEIGVRMALGADRSHVVRLVLRGAFTQVALGLLIGIPAAIGTGRLIASQLYQVEGWSPVALGTAILSLSLCALLAAIIPARRAASIDPLRALRIE